MTQRRLQFPLRDLCWLGIVCVFATVWCQNSRRLNSEKETVQSIHRENRRIVTEAKAAQRQIQTYKLAKFADIEIRKLNRAKRNQIHDLVTDLANLKVEKAENTRSFIGWETWNVWRPKTGSAFLIVFQAKRMRRIPSASSARVIMLDRDGSLASCVTFRTGWRSDILNAISARQDGWVCGTPWAQPIVIPIFPVVVYRNRRELVALGRIDRTV